MVKQAKTDENILNNALSARNLPGQILERIVIIINNHGKPDARNAPTTKAENVAVRINYLVVAQVSLG